MEVEKKDLEKEEQVEQMFSDYVMKNHESDDESKPYVEPNKPAHWSQRIAAGIVDICLIFMAIFGLYQLFNITSLGDGMRENAYEMQRIRDNYKLIPLLPDSDETIGRKIHENEEGFNDAKYAEYTIYTLPSYEGELPYKIVNNDNYSTALMDKYVETVTSDQYYKTYQFNYRLCDFGVMCLAAVISEVVFLVVVPLTNKKRATLGKLAAGTQVIHSKYQVEASWYQMVGRFLWVYIVETVLPYLIITNALVIALVVQPVLFVISLFNKRHRMLHDYVSRTEVIDKRTFVSIVEQ